jgi:hypothetical protein
LKQAKQQSQDLRQTDDFLTAIRQPGYAEKERLNKPSPLEGNPSRQLNGRPKMPRVDSFSRFSDPPAPPPQQPLPEKPDAPPRSGSESFSPLKRSDTDKAKSMSTSSPVSRESSQILSLIEALSIAKREIDTQGTRIKELEDLLREEKTARESAEDKAKKLETPTPAEEEIKTEKAHQEALEEGLFVKQEQDGVNSTGEPNGTILCSEVPSLPENKEAEFSAKAHAEQLQRRLDTMAGETEEMRKQMASFRERAETAEDETVQSRKSLAEMIETLRQERIEKAAATATEVKTDGSNDDPTKSIFDHSILTENGVAEIGTPAQNFDPGSVKSQEEDPTSNVTTSLQRRQYLEEASPYASIFGVVLLGVGLMAYLNGWQKLDK